jgi:hypothetical protein
MPLNVARRRLSRRGARKLRSNNNLKLERSAADHVEALAEQFIKLKRLREKVEELQRMAAKTEAAKRNRPPN